MPTQPRTLTYEGKTPERVDRFITSSFSGISRAYVQELILKQLVEINGKKAKKGDLVHSGSEVRIESFVRPEDRRIDPNPEISLNIAWKSDEMLVVDKPADLPTHPNDFTDTRTLANALLAQFPEIADVGDDRLRPGIVHRLDTNTSGLLLVARTQEMFRTLRKLFDERKIKKTYLALVLGDVKLKGEVAFPVAHHPRNPRKMVAVMPGIEVRSRIREAKTIFEPLERFGEYTLLKVQTLTGRMHQVRVHLSAIGHPLVGDTLYQNAKDRARDRLGLKRHFLHATKLIVPLPGEKDRTFESVLPPELQASISELSRHEG